MEAGWCMQICGGRNERICICIPTVRRFTWRMRDISWQCARLYAMKFREALASVFFFRNIILQSMCGCACDCVCVALLWQSMHINMSVLFTWLLVLLPPPTESSYLSSIYARAYAAWPCHAPLPLPVPPPTHTHIHTPSEHFTCREQFLLHTSMGAQFFPAVLFFCCCVTSGNNWILLGIFIHIYLRTNICVYMYVCVCPSR